jgi:hypothetical protein
VLAFAPAQRRIPSKGTAILKMFLEEFIARADCQPDHGPSAGGKYR